MKILITGANGYIGRRLKAKLEKNSDLNLRLFVRNKKSVLENDVEVFEGSTFDEDSLRKALSGVDTAYYLIHSMGSDNYKDLDKLSATNFINIASECGVKRVIYLGGLGVKDKNISKHLLSRIQTGEILSSLDVQTVWVRAGIIIGSGSASFEIIRNLVEKLPIMLTPKWVNTKTQPIAIEDVLSYLEKSLYLKEKENLVVDIGTHSLNYKEMMLQSAKALNLKRYMITVPFMSIKLSSHWLNIFTPVPFSLAKELIDGLKSEAVIQNDNAKKYFPEIKPVSYIDAVKKAEERIKQNQVISRWDDKGGRIWEEVHKDEFHDAIFFDRKQKDISHLDKHKIYQSFMAIGGKNGWFAYDFLWTIRGFLDKIVGGVGIKRGRRDPINLRIGDSLDFWKVVDIKKDERLLLFAQMKLPGLAWLEFKIKDDELIQSAYFYPKGVLGRFYWYTLIPLHYLVFTNMINGIVKKSENSDQTKTNGKIKRTLKSM